MIASAYYNELDPYAAQWLANLRAAGHISAGRIDTRSITEVEPDEFQAVTRAHFFAGIGGWDHALSLAGWPDDLPVWSGSCPCQPFSGAGKGRGFDDERHLWPVWFKLIAECIPPVIFGEQVVSPTGRQWWDAVSADLEGLGYSTRAFDLCAAGVGAPHIRQRLYWVAYANDAQRGPDSTRGHIGHGQDAGRAQTTGHDAERGDAGRVGNANGHAVEQHAGELHGDEGQHEVGQADSGDALEPTSGAGRLGNANDERPQGRSVRRDSPDQRPTWPAGVDDTGGQGSLAGQWIGADWLYCRDGKRRPVEPGTQPLANGLPGRVGQLRAYGNAIVPQAAAVLIRATMAALEAGA